MPDKMATNTEAADELAQMLAEKIVIDPEDFTLGELESLKREGITLADIQAGDLSAMLGLVLLRLRRADPKATMDDARAVKLGQFAISESEDPTTASLRTPPSTPISTGSARRSSRA